MVSFRFFLISVLAVFLALAIGISMGSGFLGDVILGLIHDQIDEVRRDNVENQRRIRDLERRAERDSALLDALEPGLLDGRLTGQQIVTIGFDPLDVGAVETTEQAVEAADGEIVTSLVFTDRLGLSSQVDRDDLGAIVGPTGEPAELRAALAARIGAGLAAAAADRPRTEIPRSATRLQVLVESLEEADFLVVDRSADRPLVPSNARFVIVGGGVEIAPYDVASFGVDLVLGLTSSGAAAVVAERSESGWGLVPAVRNDERAVAVASTVDALDPPGGDLILGLALDRAVEGSVGHYGFEEGSSAPIPTDDA